MGRSAITPDTRELRRIAYRAAMTDHQIARIVEAADAIDRHKAEISAILHSIPVDLRVHVREGRLENELASLAATATAMVQVLESRRSR